MRATLLALVLGVLAVALAGCGESAGSRAAIDLKDVPPDLMKVAKEKLPDVTFETAWKKANGDFEVRGKTKTGKVREIDLRPDGSVQDIE